MQPREDLFQRVVNMYYELPTIGEFFTILYQVLYWKTTCCKYVFRWMCVKKYNRNIYCLINTIFGNCFWCNILVNFLSISRIISFLKDLIYGGRHSRGNVIFWKVILWGVPYPQIIIGWPRVVDWLLMAIVTCLGRREILALMADSSSREPLSLKLYSPDSILSL